LLLADDKIAYVDNKNEMNKNILDTQLTHRNFWVFRVLVSTLRMKAEADSSIRGQKDFICREEKGCMGVCSRTWK
jgi:hypothetical protein